MKTKQDKQMPEIPDFGQAQKFRGLKYFGVIATLPLQNLATVEKKYYIFIFVDFYVKLLKIRKKYLAIKVTSPPFDG